VVDKFSDNRLSVRVLCGNFLGKCWRNFDRIKSYPTQFVNPTNKNGSLGVLIPEKYGSSGMSISVAAATLEKIYTYTPLYQIASIFADQSFHVNEMSSRRGKGNSAHGCDRRRRFADDY
jgi:hypothetical protein